MMQVSLPSEYRRPSLALGLTPVLADTLRVKEGGPLRHIFFDIGHDQLIAFLEPHDVPDVPAELDAGINRGLGVPAGFYHFAFEAGSPAALADKRDELRAEDAEARISSITDGPGRSTSRIPTACRSSIAARCAISPRMTR